MALSDERTKAIPWTESVVPGNRLLYMPFLEYQLEYMRKNVEGLKELPFEEHLSMQKSSRKPGIIESWQYESKDYRKIRLTYIDCGIGAQVFNSVWYPRYNTDAPIFGIDAAGMVNEWNRKAVAITGFSKQEVMGQHLVKTFITDELQDSVQEVLEKALAGEETDNFEFPLYTKDGRRVASAEVGPCVAPDERAEYI